MTDADNFAPLTAREIQNFLDVVDNRKVVNDIEILSPIPATAGDVREFAGKVTGLGSGPDSMWTYRDLAGSDQFHIGRWNSARKRKSGLFAGLGVLPASIGFRAISPRRGRCMVLIDWRWPRTMRPSSLSKGREPQKPQGLSSRAVSW